MEMNLWLKRTFLSFLVLIATIVFGSNQWVNITVFGSVTGNTETLPKVVCNNKGHAAIAWMQGGHPYASVFMGNGTWETPTMFNTADEIDICMDEDGNITVATLLQQPNNQVVSYFRAAGSLSWLEAGIFLPNPADPTLELQSIRVTSTAFNRQALYMWVDTKGGSEKICSKYRASGIYAPSLTTDFHALPTGASLPNGRTDPIPRMLGDGSVQVVYLLDDAGSDNLYYNTFTSPGTWGAQVLVGFTMTPPAKFDFDTNAYGNGMIVGFSPGTAPKVSYHIGGSWSTPAAMGMGTPETMSTAVDNKNKATVVWIDNASQQVFAKPPPMNSLPGDWTTGLSPVSTSGANSSAAISSSLSGNTLIGWGDTTRENAFCTKHSINNSFGPISTIDVNAAARSLCINNSGTAFAAWVDNTLPGKPIKVAVSIDPAANLIQALSKKRRIYQTGLYP